MKRRYFLTASAAALTAAAAPLTISNAASNHQAYTWDRYQQALAGGKPFLLDFYASW